MNNEQDFFLADEHGGRGRLLIASCQSGLEIASKVFNRYNDYVKASGGQKEIQFLSNIDRRFSDKEVCVRLKENVRGTDVFLFQSLANPVNSSSIDENYMAFLVAVRALRENGANRITGVLPYLAYARQDKPSRFMREPTTARLMADLSIAAGMDQLVTWEPHQQPQALYGSTKVDALDALNFMIHEFKNYKGREDIIAVAPDAGAAEFITDFADKLNLSYALAEKHRPKPGVAEIANIVGNFSGKKTAIILDDMIAGAGTMFALVQKIINETSVENVYIGVSHNLCLPEAYDRLVDLYHNHHLLSVIVTNSIPQTERFLALDFLQVRCLSGILARTINCIHYNQSVSEHTYKS